MNETLLWVNKDASSRTLSRSSKAETARIRAHVQHLKIRSRAKKKVVTTRNTRSESTSSSDDKNVNNDIEPNAVVRSPTQSPPKNPSPPFTNRLTWLPASTSEEKRAFVFFLRRTAQEWSGWRDVSFWCRLVPQASNNHDAIFHSAAALGALHELFETENDDHERATLRQLSLRQCNKAAVAANKGPISYTVALMSCIIMVCLQNLQSNPVAFQMLRTGTNLVRDIEEKLKAGTITLSRTETSLLNDYLKPILERLGTRYCFLVDLPSAFALHVTSKLQSETLLVPNPNLPEKFTNLLEARNALERIANWAVANGTMWTEHSGLFCSDLPNILSHIKRWRYMLDEVPSASIQEHPGLQSSKILLKAAGLVTEILFDTLGSHDERVFDKHLDKFVEIVQIYNTVSQISRVRRRQKISFGIDTGILHTLAFVVGRCRDPKVRRDALELMLRDDHVEGDMRASTGSNILRRLIELEEAGENIKNQSDIPEQRRTRIWEDHQWWHEGKVKIFFIRSPYDPEKGAAFLEEWASMPIRVSSEDEQPASPEATPPPPQGLPNVIFGRGKAAFLDESTNTYNYITLSSFFLPIPRM